MWKISRRKVYVQLQHLAMTMASILSQCHRVPKSQTGSLSDQASRLPRCAALDELPEPLGLSVIL